MLDNFFQNLSSLAGGLPIDQIRFISSVLLTYPVAYLYRYLPKNSPNLKHIFNIIVTTFLFLGIHDQYNGFIHLIMSCIVTYSILLFVKPDQAPKLIFIWAMGHMSYTHLYRQIYDYGQATLDYSGPQMIWTIKLTMIAWNVRDGVHKDEELTDYQKVRKITKVPTILEFLGYIFFFCGFASGPAFDYAEYMRFVEQRDELSNKNIPSSVIPAFKCFINSIVYLILTLTVSPIFSLSYTLRPEFTRLTFFNKFAYVVLSAAMERTRYYFAWLLAEGGCILSGFGYNGLDEKGNHKWDRMTNVKVIEIETSQNLRGIIDNWNIGTNKWLRHYVYLRIAPPGTKNTAFASLCSFATSAFWHGFYPGYYLTFLFVGLVNETAKNLRRSLRPLVLHFGKSNPTIIQIYNILGWGLSQITLSYFILPFIILEFGSSLTIWKQLFFIGHLYLLVLWIFFKFGGVKLFKSLHPKEEPISKKSD